MDRKERPDRGGEGVERVENFHAVARRLKKWTRPAAPSNEENGFRGRTQLKARPKTRFCTSSLKIEFKNPKTSDEQSGRRAREHFSLILWAAISLAKEISLRVLVCCSPYAVHLPGLPSRRTIQRLALRSPCRPNDAASTTACQPRSSESLGKGEGEGGFQRCPIQVLSFQCTNSQPVSRW